LPGLDAIDARPAQLPTRNHAPAESAASLVGQRAVRKAIDGRHQVGDEHRRLAEDQRRHRNLSRAGRRRPEPWDISERTIDPARICLQAA
jgi:hypothetical protein